MHFITMIEILIELLVNLRQLHFRKNVVDDLIPSLQEGHNIEKRILPCLKYT